MVELILATIISCSESKKIVQNIMESKETVLQKHELIETIRTNTESGCYEENDSTHS